jgi:hypothetical protein
LLEAGQSLWSKAKRRVKKRHTVFGAENDMDGQKRKSLRWWESGSMGYSGKIVISSLASMKPSQ